MTTVHIRQRTLVVLIGASSSGKSTFARRHFGADEVVSSDECRRRVAGDENAMHANPAAFALLHHMVAARLGHGQLAVVDATNLLPRWRAPLLQLARDHNAAALALAFDLPLPLLTERHHGRSDRGFDESVLHNQVAQLRRGLRSLRSEGFAEVVVLKTAEAIESLVIDRSAATQRAGEGAEIRLGEQREADLA